MNVPLSRPDISDLEIEYVTRVLRSGQLSLGPRVQEFEERFARYVGVKHAIAMNSGTSALHVAICALGIGSGDEVITSSFSFVASTNCLLYERALPVFVDIDPITLNLDPHEIRRYIRNCCLREPKTGALMDVRTGRYLKAILPVHVFGLPCDMDPILDIARENNLQVIEDACEALGARYKSRSVGTFGNLAVFAFYPNKQMTTGEGGMVVTNDHDLAAACRSLRNQGRDPSSEWLRHSRLGYNYRLSDIHCALGLAQLERLEGLLVRREKAAEMYTRALAGNSMIRLPQTPADFNRTWFIYPVQFLEPTAGNGLNARDRVLQKLRDGGVGCQSYFPAIHKQPYFQETGITPECRLPHTEAASESCLALPMFSTATPKQIRYVCDTLLAALQKETEPLKESVMTRH